MIVVAGIWLGLLVVGYVGGRLYGRYTLRRDGGDGRARGTYRLLATVGLGTGLVLAFSGLLETIQGALSAVHPALSGGLMTTVSWLPVFGGAIIVMIVTYLGIFPYARERRGLDISATVATARLARYLSAFAIVGLAVIALNETLLSASDPDPQLIPLLWVLLGSGTYVWSQYSIRLTQTILEPTAEQRRRLEDAADRADLSATIGGVLSGHETEVAALFLDGPFWNRRAYATDYALDTLDEEALTALCARTKAADERRLLERKALVASALFGVFVTLYVWSSFLLAVVALCVAWPLCSRYLQRCVFAADRHAARTVEAETLASALEAGTNISDSRSWLHERLSSTPSRARRLERLERLDS